MFLVGIRICHIEDELAMATSSRKIAMSLWHEAMSDVWVQVYSDSVRDLFVELQRGMRFTSEDIAGIQDRMKALASVLQTKCGDRLPNFTAKVFYRSLEIERQVPCLEVYGQ